MARQNIQIQIDTAVESAQSAQSLGQLRRALVDIRDLQSQIGDESSAEFQQLQQAANNTTRRLAATREAIGDINDSVRTLDGSPVERMSNSFGLLRESVVNVDFDKFKTGLSGIGAALKANPIFMLGAVIVGITIAIGAVLAAFGLLGPVLDGIKRMVGDLVKGFFALTDAMGITRKAEEQLAEASKKSFEERMERLNQERGIYSQLLQLREVLTDRELALIAKKAGVEIDFLKDVRTEAQLNYEVNEAQIALMQKEIDEIRSRQKANRDMLEADKARYDELQKLLVGKELEATSLRVAKEKEAAEIKAGLEDQYNQIVISNITDQRRRRIEEINLKKQEDLAELDRKIEALKVENKNFAQQAALKVQIERQANLQIAEVNKAARREAITEEMDDLNNHYRLRLLQTQENTQERLVVEKDYREKQLSLMKKHQNDLELSNDEIKAKELEFAQQIENINKQMYENLKRQAQEDLNNWETNEQIKVQSTLDGSIDRLQAEQTYLKNKLTYYQDNYLKLGMSENEYQLFKLKLTEDYNKKTGEVNTAAAQKMQEDIGLIAFDAIEKAQINWAIATSDFFKVVKDGPFGKFYETQLIPANDFFNAVMGRTLETTKSMEDVVKTFGFSLTALKEELDASIQSQEFSLRTYTNTAALLKNQLQSTLEEPFAALTILPGISIGGEMYNAALDASKSYYGELQQQRELDYQLNKAKEERVYLDFLAQSQATYLEKLSKVQKGSQEEEIITQNFYKQMTKHKELYELGLNDLARENSLKRNEITKQEADTNFKIQQEAQNRFFNISKNTISGISSITDAYFKTRMANVKKGSEEEQKLAKQQFDTQKAFNIGLAVINGLQSILAITSVPDFTLGIQSGIRIAAQIALNAATIAGIAAQQFQGAGGSSGGGGGGGGGTPPPAMSPDLGVLQSLYQGVNQMGQEVAPPPTFQAPTFFGLGAAQMLGGPNMQGPNRVYVLETDITETQNKVSVIEQRALFV